MRIIGGGFAGSEAAWLLAQAGHAVRLSEMCGGGGSTPAHESDRLAEMVCSNSFRSDDAEHNAVGLLHQEMGDLGSLTKGSADKHQVPTGLAIGVDREALAAQVTRAVQFSITDIRERGRCSSWPPRDHRDRIVHGIRLRRRNLDGTGGGISFLEAIAPIVHRDSIEMDAE